MKELKKEAQSLQSLETYWRAFSLDHPEASSLSCEKAFWSILGKTVPKPQMDHALWHIQGSTKS